MKQRERVSTQEKEQEKIQGRESERDIARKRVRLSEIDKVRQRE